MSETNQPDAGETCSASRHVLAMAVDIARDGHCQHIVDEPAHCAESMLATVQALWDARNAARAMVVPDIAEVERLLCAHESAIRQHDRGAEWDEAPSATRTALLDAVRSIAAERGQFRAATKMVPGGWKLVPVEPTPEMLDAASHASMQHLLDCIKDPAKSREVGSEENVRKTWASRYRCMLAAAPQPVGEVPMPEADGRLDLGWGAFVRLGCELFNGDPNIYATKTLRTYGEQCRAAGYAAGVAAERERCAKLSADERFVYSDEEWRVRCDVADAIRDPNADAALRGEVK